MNLHTYLMVKNAQLTYVPKKYKGLELTDNIQRSWTNFVNRNYRNGMDSNQFVRDFINQYDMPEDMSRKQQIRRLWRAMDHTPGKRLNNADTMAKKTPGKWLNENAFRKNIRALNGELKRTLHLTSIPGLP